MGKVTLEFYIDYWAFFGVTYAVTEMRQVQEFGMICMYLYFDL